jgi:fluoride ion exporter CrcB/FEX
MSTMLITPPDATRRSGTWRWLVVAPVGGAAVGAVARWWMRLITDDPEFSWDGTIAIVVAFTLLAIGHSIAWVARTRARRRRWSTPPRVLGGVLTLPIFVGAGVMMLPTVFGAGLAMWRSDWPRWSRWIAGAVAVPIPAYIAIDVLRHEPSAGRAFGVILLAATYGLVITTLGAVLAPLDDGWRSPRWLRRCCGAAGVAFTLAVVALVAGIATA